MNIQAKTAIKGYWVKIQIVAVTEGWSQQLKDGQWVNVSFDTCETLILELGKCFDTHEDAEKFIETKPFKNLLKQVQKGGLV